MHVFLSIKENSHVITSALQNIAGLFTRRDDAKVTTDLVQVTRHAKYAVVSGGQRGIDSQGMSGAQVLVGLVASASVHDSGDARHRAVVFERCDHNAVVELGHSNRLS